MRAWDRRLAKLEAVSHAVTHPLVSPETLERMAAEYARIREKLLGDGPSVPAADRSMVDSPARAILRRKLLRDDSGPGRPAQP